MTFARTLVLALTLPLTLASPAGAGPATSVPLLIFEGDGGDDALRAEWAFGQFAAAGLRFYDLEVRFVDDSEPCNGNGGLHRYVDGGHLVFVCTSDAAQRGRTLVHELAHVWAAQNVDPVERSEFLVARGLDEWHSLGVVWEERGTEHAAEIIAWGVNDHPCWVLPRAQIGDRDIDRLSAQFELLTGFPPRCDAEANEPDDERLRQTID